MSHLDSVLAANKSFRLPIGVSCGLSYSALMDVSPGFSPASKVFIARSPQGQFAASRASTIHENPAHPSLQRSHAPEALPVHSRHRIRSAHRVAKRSAHRIPIDVL